MICVYLYGWWSVVAAFVSRRGDVIYAEAWRDLAVCQKRKSSTHQDCGAVGKRISDSVYIYVAVGDCG